MDADFSHPRGHSRLLETIVGGADFRHRQPLCRGWQHSGGLGWRQRLISRGNSNLPAVLRPLAVRDCTAGFRAIRTDVLKRIDLAGLGVKGYVFQIALLHAASCAQGRRSKRCRYAVRRACARRLKLGLSDIVESSIMPFRLRLHDSPDFHQVRPGRGAGGSGQSGRLHDAVSAGLEPILPRPSRLNSAIASNFRSTISGPSAARKEGSVPPKRAQIQPRIDHDAVCQHWRSSSPRASFGRYRRRSANSPVLPRRCSTSSSTHAGPSAKHRPGLVRQSMTLASRRMLRFS